jgi:hypothetical protein
MLLSVIPFAQNEEKKVSGLIRIMLTKVSARFARTKARFTLPDLLHRLPRVLLSVLASCALSCLRSCLLPCLLSSAALPQVSSLAMVVHLCRSCSRSLFAVCAPAPPPPASPEPPAHVCQLGQLVLLSSSSPPLAPHMHIIICVCVYSIAHVA